VRDMEIINGQIHTMGAQGVIKHGAVRVENGKIAWVGTMKQWQEMRHADSAGSELDGSDQVLDAGGGWVMPGIIEAHCHMGITEEKKGMEGDDCNETVDPVTPWLRAIDAINSMDAAFDDAVRAGITAAMVGPGSSNVVGGQFALIKTHGRRIDDILVKAPAAMKVAFGENPKVNYSGQIFRNTYSGDPGLRRPAPAGNTDCFPPGCSRWWVPPRTR